MSETVTDAPAGNASLPNAFRLTAVERARAPHGAQGSNWYRYTVTGSSTVTGYYRGSRQEVVDHATRFADQLNERIQFGLRTHVSRKKKTV